MTVTRRCAIPAILGASVLATAAFLAGLYGGWFPLGVAGEWTWSRLPRGVGLLPETVLIGLAALAAYAAFAGFGRRALERASVPVRAVWVAALGPLAAGVSLALQSAAPAGYGLAKWVFALHAPGSSGYYTVARSAEMNDPAAFLKNYPEWVARGDALHIGTHPPGLFVLWRGILGGYRAAPGLAGAVVDAQPEQIRAALRTLQGTDPIGLADRAALATVGWLILLAGAFTSWMLYALARRLGREPLESWAAGALWGVVPSALLFQPTSDVLFALPATVALACAARGRVIGCLAAGAVLAAGMQFSLVFLAVGLVVGLVLASQAERSPRQRVAAILATGLGFLAATAAFWAIGGASPFAIWWANQRNHARFYAEFPRSWAAWQVANVAEVAVGLGLALVPWVGVGLFARPACRVSLAAVGVLACLQLSGRSLSEVARLWIPLFPALVLAGAGGLRRLGAGGWTLAIVVVLMGLELLGLQGAVQVVYSMAYTG
jgi:xanthosine utilization system XapX-like protein